MCKMNESQRGSCKLCQQPSVVYTWLKVRKIKFDAYFHIPLNQNLDEKSYKSAEMEAVKQVQFFF